MTMTELWPSNEWWLMNSDHAMAAIACPCNDAVMASNGVLMPSLTGMVWVWWILIFLFLFLFLKSNYNFFFLYKRQDKSS